MSGRRRSSSFGIPKVSNAPDTSTTIMMMNAPTAEALQATQQLWELVCLAMEDPLTKQTLLHSSRNVCLIKALLDRAHQLDHYSRSFRFSASAGNNHVSKSGGNNNFQQQTLALLHNSQWLSTMLRQGDGESGYTPLHRAVLQADLPVILLLLRYAVALPSSVGGGTTLSSDEEEWTSVMSQRLQHRPLALLLQGGGDSSTISDQVRAILQTVDAEGLTAGQLMQKLQIKTLEHCRKSLVYSPLNGGTMMMDSSSSHNGTGVRRPRQNSFEAMLQHDHERQQNELADLHHFMTTQQEQQRRAATSVFANGSYSSSSTSYACEVLAFGRANHLALGVQTGNNSSKSTTTTTAATSCSSSDATTTTTTFRPYRVQEFAQDRVGREGSAVAVAAAAHHTLVVTRQGHLYAFGVGTGGRLGTGDNEKHCPAPTRVLGPLQKRRVVAISAAENHSLCVTSDGAVYAFGSNRFGQLGYSSSSISSGGDTTCSGGGSSSNDSGSRCCLPRRVDDLWKKHVLCIGVAAGEKHSVALSQKGEVYVWGCNASGQLGINHRRSASSSGVAHKVQRVDALWNHDKTRVCFQVAASAQATLVIAKPTPGGLPVNQVYAWGHGNHVPAKVHFSDPSEANRTRGQTTKENVFLAAGSAGRSVNPVAIACARHHSAAITSDGRVYTWGFHADTLGASTKNNKAATKNPNTRPQLVTGMLPEEGGGFAVAVSASENHTAVVTNDGSLFTWGASYGKGLMGHEGVRWQPSPKRVGGVSRAVGVSAGKEHTVLLMGASFPTLATKSSSPNTSLEQLAAQEVAKHVDLFNVLPILMTAERTNSRFLIDHCKRFIHFNIDGVLNVAQKSTMELYLRESVANGLLLLDEEPRDRRERPIVLDIALATYNGRKGILESETVPSDPLHWIRACQKLCKNESLISLLHRLRRAAANQSPLASTPKALRRRASSSAGSASEAFKECSKQKRSDSLASDPGRDRKLSSSERCILLTSNMDLSTRELVQAKYDCLTREVRGLKKRLSQIAKLEAIGLQDQPEDDPAVLSSDQRDKIARRPQLESELCIFEPALERVERRMLQFNLRLKRPSVGCAEECKGKAVTTDSAKTPDEGHTSTEHSTPTEEESSIADNVSLRCDVCRIACPDQKSLALHLNGRKHRNRVAQEAEKEKARTAASMMEQRKRQQMDEMNKNVEVRRVPPPETASPWSKGNAKASSLQSKYKLSPQENVTQEIVENHHAKPKSFHEIMEEEASKAKTQVVAASPKPMKVANPLQLPPGSAPALKSPPWGGKALIGPNTGARVPASPTVVSKPSAGSPWLHVVPKTIPLQLPPGAAPELKSPPWATKPTKSFSSTSPQLVAASPQHQGKSPKPSSSFGDFLRRAPATPVSPPRPSSAPWSPSAVAGVSLPVPVQQTSTPTVSFEAIQKQEEDFKHVQDQSYKDNGKWFIERRERAGSFAAIQEAATKQREEELFIEEQKQIEEQIQREQALKKKKEAQKKKKDEKKKRQKAKKAKEIETKGDGSEPKQQQTQKKQGKKGQTKDSDNKQRDPENKNTTPNPANTKSKGGGNKFRKKNPKPNNKTQTKASIQTAATAKP